MQRKRISSGTTWESDVGYSRAIRVGNLIYVSGTTATDADGYVVAVGDPYGQTRYIFQKIAGALAEINASLSDVVRTRMYVTDMSAWADIGRAHGEFFGDIRPAATMVEVSGLIDPDHLVEIEVDAVTDDEPRIAR